MRARTFLIGIMLVLGGNMARAQWVVTDPGNLAQSIINMSDNIAHTSKTAVNTADNFAETVKIYEQAKKYYDQLKAVNNLIQDARKVRDIILMVGDVSDIYVTNFKKMMNDDNFSSRELDAIAFGYTRLLEESNGVLQDLKQVINVSTLSMTDKDRMDVVDNCYYEMRRYRNLVSYYTNKNIAVSYLRARKKNDMERVMRLYGNETSKYWYPMVPLTIDFANLHTILGTLYEDMLPLCKDMMDVGKGLAGLGALFYVAVRIWQSMARAEPIDVYPLLRPFAIGICILLFPTLVLGTLNTVLSPIVQGTHKMLEGQTLDMERYRAQKEELEKEAMLRNPETAYLVSDEEFDRQLDELGWSTVDTASRLGMYVEVGMYNLEKKIRDTFRSLLELIFAAASLLIDTVRTFFLVVLSILGPVAFAFSVWDGFQSTLGQWFTRYISVYLWLPVSDLFSTLLAKLQVLMLQNDIQELQNNPDYSIDNSNSVYIIFMLIGIIGYFTVPTVAGWIVQAGGAGNFSRNLNRTATKTGSFAAGVGGAVLGNIGGRLRGK